MPTRLVAAAVLVAVVLVAAVAAACSGSQAEPDAAPATSETAPETTIGSPEVQPSETCGSTTRPAAPELIEVVVDGTPRRALVHVPDGAGEPLPVIVSFHGLDGSAEVQRSTDGLVEVADRDGVVVVHPQGLEVGLNDEVTATTGWDADGPGADGDGVDEPAFVEALLDELGATVCIDTAAVSATGFSAGGNIALVVACALPDRIAAVAPVGAAYQAPGCPDRAAMPVLAFHGEDDRIIPIDGRDDAAGRFLAADDVLGAQAAHNGCDPEPTTSQPSSGVEVLTWTGCDAPTVLYRVADHGHAWPASALPFDRATLAGVLAGGASGRPNQLMVAIGLTPDEMADNVLLSAAEPDASALIRDFVADQRTR